MGWQRVGDDLVTEQPQFLLSCDTLVNCLQREWKTRWQEHLGDSFHCRHACVLCLFLLKHWAYPRNLIWWAVHQKWVPAWDLRGPHNNLIPDMSLAAARGIWRDKLWGPRNPQKWPQAEVLLWRLLARKGVRSVEASRFLPGDQQVALRVAWSWSEHPCCFAVFRKHGPFDWSGWEDSLRILLTTCSLSGHHLWLLCKEKPLFWDCSPRDLLNRLTCKLLGEFRPQGGSRGLAWSEALASSVGRPDRGRCFPPHQAVGKGGEWASILEG